MKNGSVLNFTDFKPLSARVPRVTSHLSLQDKWGALKVRLAINRHSYAVAPGIYAIGKPDSQSDVFVTSNYKLTFDIVRRNLEGLNAWILVLDTKGVNVWCAAGKGTFGTAELVRRIQLTSLKDIVSHKRLILPQLGAVGVAAYKIKELTGFSVTFGPVRAADIRSFVEKGYKATPDMRRVDFPWFERLKLVPVEIVLSYKYLLIALILLLGLAGIYQTGYSFDLILSKSPVVLMNLLVGYLAGTLITPLVLPYVPFRSFSAKGLVVGLFSAILPLAFNLLGNTPLEILSWLMVIGSISSFLAMNFTGASTYTSLSGVKKEMRIAIPLQIGFAAVGLILFTLSAIF
ncbi:MAG: mercury methylation corrinoid protein HgcA [Bacteroidales bacterium]|nr:mercury methylation corrinoid protein HgcA [Bacteroidales bacterium]